MECPHCNKVLRAKQQKRLDYGFKRYQCARCYKWCRDNDKKTLWSLTNLLLIAVAVAYRSLDFPNPNLAQGVFLVIILASFLACKRQKELIKDTTK